MTKEDDRTILNLHASAISQLMLLVYMSTWFDDIGDDGAGGDVLARVPAQNLSCGAVTLADAWANQATSLEPFSGRRVRAQQHNDLHNVAVL